MLLQNVSTIVLPTNRTILREKNKSKIEEAGVEKRVKSVVFDEIEAEDFCLNSLHFSGDISANS